MKTLLCRIYHLKYVINYHRCVGQEDIEQISISYGGNLNDYTLVLFVKYDHLIVNFFLDYSSGIREDDW